MLKDKKKMLKNKKRNLFILSLIIFLLAFTACASGEPPGGSGEPDAEGPAEIIGAVILATTTSTQDSGLLDYLLPVFTYDTGYEVDVIAVGSGKAMQMGKDGDADVLLVHSPKDEEAFVQEGHGPARYDVMYNDFVLLGPADDPAGIREAAPDKAQDAFRKLYDGQVTFVSRGDESGTHKKELSIWEKLGVTPEGDWYVSAGKGMGEVITMTNEMLGYTLSDRATWLNMADQTDLEIVTEGDADLYNQYGVIVIDPEKSELINAEGALAFQEWILSEKAQSLISGFGVEEYGQSLFTPNAVTRTDS